MNTQNINTRISTATTVTEIKTIQLVQAERPKQFAAVDMWNIQKQRKMIFRRSA